MTRQAYTAPTLKAHGRIEELTHSGGTTYKTFGSADGMVLICPCTNEVISTLKNFSGVC